MKILDKTVELFKLTGKLCAITSDNAQYCVNARDVFAKKHSGFTSINDQSHVADLLMEYLMEPEWLEIVFQKVSTAWSIVESHKKTQERSCGKHGRLK